MAGIVVNTNIPSMQVQRNLNDATSGLNKAIERMTTGLKINRAADDAAGMFVASGLETQIRGSEIAQGSIQTGVNILQIAEGDLSLIEEHVLRIRDLATQAASDYYTADARTAMAAEAEQRALEIIRIAEASNFNGKELLAEGSSAEIRLQVGPNADEETNSITLSGVFGDATAKTLGLTTSNTAADVKTQMAEKFNSATNAAAFIGTCDTVLGKITTKRTAIGAIQNRLDSAYTSLVVKNENLSAAKSTIMDADIAKESSEYTKQQILQQASASLLVQANQAPSIALNLI